jgi:hypothetical protein
MFNFSLNNGTIGYYGSDVSYDYSEFQVGWRTELAETCAEGL